MVSWLRSYFRRPLFPYLILVLIITIPAFLSILNNAYFTMHDDQHIARLFLLDQGIRQGVWYPRWVDMLGFGYGYPLFNFYPPLIYYIAEIFHLLGFSLIWSMKLFVITGFIVGAWGMFLFVNKLIGKWAALIASTLYTYFFYHSVLAYVRGAFAEFFSLTILPFVFLTLKNLSDKTNPRNTVIFAVIFALLILCHPLIAFPSLFFVGFFFLFLLYLKKDKAEFIKLFLIACLLGLGISAFFWMPSVVEKKYTYVDTILTHELADYRIHFIYPQQFLYSLWGYGGSIFGPNDGFTFQLGKLHIGLALIAVVTSFFYFAKKRKDAMKLYFPFFCGITLFSLYMTLGYSSFIWNNVQYLWYLQFPWRFLTFATIFLAVVASFTVYFFKDTKIPIRSSLKKYTIPITTLFICFVAIFIYSKYFHPQALRYTSDKELTTFHEIGWNISRTSFEFVPKGIRTTKTALNTTTLDIKENELPQQTFLIFGDGYADQITKSFSRKTFLVHAVSPLEFQLQTYNFPGWTAYISSVDPLTKAGKQLKLAIRDDNDLKLITVDIPKGLYNVTFVFQDTPVRRLADMVSIVTLMGILVYFFAFGSNRSLLRKNIKRMNHI